MEVTEHSESSSSPRYRLLVRGVVQGLGFRPYVYQLAKHYHLAGFVRNASLGVVIEVQGQCAALDVFIRALPEQGPPLMRVRSIDHEVLAPEIGEDFIIRESEVAADALAMVPADVSALMSPMTAHRQPWRTSPCVPNAKKSMTILWRGASMLNRTSALPAVRVCGSAPFTDTGARNSKKGLLEFSCRS